MPLAPSGKPTERKYINIIKVIYDKPSEKAMATHSNPLAGKIPWTEEPGRQQSMGLLGVGHY